MRKTKTAKWICPLTIALFSSGFYSARAGGQGILPPGVEKLCAIQFDLDLRRAARVEDRALPCLTQAANRLHQDPNIKLVLVGIADPVKDHADFNNGKERMTEDTTGYDIRYEDVAAYRSINTKLYLTQWYGISAARILPTTDEKLVGQQVTFYLVPAAADYNHNYLDTTRTRENPCTVKPCYDPKEESLRAQPRTRIRRAGPLSEEPVSKDK